MKLCKNFMVKAFNDACRDTRLVTLVMPETHSIYEFAMIAKTDFIEPRNVFLTNKSQGLHFDC